jgi:hypothetical protein
MRRLALILALFSLLGMGRKLPSLAESTVVYLAEPGCAEYTPIPEEPPVMPSYLVQQNRGDVWATVEWGVGVLQPDDCLAFHLLATPAFRACCAGPGDVACSEPAAVGAQHECARIFALGSGEQYPQDQVDEFNAGG